MAISLTNAFKALITVITIPLVCSYRALLSLKGSPESHKSWRRLFSDAAFRWQIQNLPILFAAQLMGKMTNIMTAWAKEKEVQLEVDDLSDNGKLYWVKSHPNTHSSKVILYIHGGGFMTPFVKDGSSFWLSMQYDLKKVHGIEADLAILDYSLFPEVQFPVPLRQTISAVQHILATVPGISPSDILITGDSAGGNLSLQLASHILHPLADLPRLDLPEGSKFAGIYIMSPWYTLGPRIKETSNEPESYEQNAAWDIITPKTINEFRQILKEPVPMSEEYLPYIDSRSNPPGWFRNLSSIVPSLLISVGEKECLRDDILAFADDLEKEVAGTRLNLKVVIDENGVHDDPFFDCMAGETKKGKLAMTIIQWCSEVLSK